MKICLRLSAARLLHIILLSASCFLGRMASAQTVASADSITVAIAPAYDSVGGFHRFWLGEGYRKIWAAPVPLKVFHLDKEKGGLKVTGIGGGFQTKSLRLQDASGRHWALRSVQKYPERKLPEYLRKTVAERILQDQVVTAHPFGALTVPVLADALQVLHTNPQMVYVPDDTTLGEYRKDFGNTVLLFEERGAVDTFLTISTEAVQAAVESNPGKHINQRAVLRARLLDLLLGDWDRHEGQWRWQARKEGSDTVYYPVPQDRDYVFYSTSGVLPWMVSQQYLNARFQSFREHVRDVEVYNFINRNFDRYFLNSLAEDDWKEEIETVQKSLTDDVIKRAVRRMPDTIYALSGEQITKTLIARRGNLKEDAMEYYGFLSKSVDVPATAAAETVAVVHKEGGAVDVTISQADNSAAKTLYHRLFIPSVTKEIRLYGLGGEDQFAVSGTESSSIKVRMIGGDGKDVFAVNNDNPNKRKLLQYDRKDEENTYATNALRRASTDTAVNRFNKQQFKYNVSKPFFSLFYNIDQRTVTSIGWTWTTSGFRREPYASRHQLIGGYSPSRGSFAFLYDADWRHVFGKNGLNFHLVSLGPKNLQNFFGTGNETPFPPNSQNGKRIYFYRNRYDLVHADLRIKHFMSQHVAWSAGLAAQYYTSKAENNEGKLLGVYNTQHPDEQVFLSRLHGGVGAGIEVDTRNNVVLPTNGVTFSTDLRVMTQLRGEKRTFTGLQSDFGFHLRLTRDSGVVLSNRIGGGTTFGEPAFYQMMQLGGRQNLRGFNTARFTGRSMLFHNAELRVKLFQFTSYLFPGTFGLVGFHDIGRVWMPGEESTKWHNGYGGGIYIVPADVVLIRALIGHSKETTQFYFNFAFGL